MAAAPGSTDHIPTYVPMPSVQSLRGWWHLLRLGALPPRIPSKPHHAPHHVEQRVALPRDLDAKIQLSDGGKGLVPAAHLFQVWRIVLGQLLEEVGTTPLDGQQEQAEEIEQWQ